jgi:hypothetical protein
MRKCHPDFCPVPPKRSLREALGWVFAQIEGKNRSLHCATLRSG